MSYIFKKTPDIDDRFDTMNVTIETQHNQMGLNDLLLAFEQFLRGCGYEFDGIVTIERDEPEPPVHAEIDAVGNWAEAGTSTVSRKKKRKGAK